MKNSIAITSLVLIFSSGASFAGVCFNYSGQVRSVMKHTAIIKDPSSKKIQINLDKVDLKTKELLVRSVGEKVKICIAPGAAYK